MIYETERQGSLPDLPSELIEVALRDLEKAEQDPRYDIRMTTWHLGGAGRVNAKARARAQCVVCQAGAVMAFSLGAPINADMTPSRYDDETRGKLSAINEFRAAGLATGLMEMGLRDPVDVDNDVESTQYMPVSRHHGGPA